ncbi:MAG: glycoside hydrolase family 2 TIM barrel-domain containing protein [Deltaproteobacteria bacterium]
MVSRSQRSCAGLPAGRCEAQRSLPAGNGVSRVALLALVCALAAGRAYAQESRPSSAELITKARTAQAQKNYEDVFNYTQELIDAYKSVAREEQASLKEFPGSKQEIEMVQPLNDVATAYFIQAESYRDQGKIQEAIASFNTVVEQYGYAQAWDPRGWYYKLAQVAKEGIDRLEGRDVEAEKCATVPTTTVDLYDPGKEEIIDYEKYGVFDGIGTKDYKYTVKDQEGLSEAAGEGIYPNTTSVRWDPLFQKLKKEKRLEGGHWDFLHSRDLQAAFFKWTLAPEPPGIRQYYTALILEKSGSIKHAIKAYYAVVVHFPYTVGWTYWHTPWYVGPSAIARIKYLCKKYPQVGMKLDGASIVVDNGFDGDIRNDVFIVDPGRLTKDRLPQTISDRIRKFIDEKIMRSKIKRRLGSGKVRLVQYENGGWQLLVDNKPYTIKGITYAVAKVGQSPDNGSLASWMDYDYNHNGKCDGPYDAFIDANGNDKQDRDEPAIGDFELLRRMGVNTIRLYDQPFPLENKLLRDLYKRYGIRVVIGDFLGKYAIGSGASWEEGTDYDNPEHKKKMLASVKAMVLKHKDEPYVLMWLLGNENVYGVACNADKKPESFFKFVNEAARLIKSLDPDHPVAVASGDVLFLDRFAAYAPDVDVFGANAYRGDQGFGSFWRNVKRLADRPAMITEYGCPAYVYCYSREDAEEAQAEYLTSCWGDIGDNMAFGDGAGNAIGGFLFEFLDEWWKAYEPTVHDTKGLWVGPFPDGFMHEEWLGVAGQGDGSQSPFLRRLRRSYDAFQKLWRE